MAEISINKVWKKYGNVDAVKGIEFACEDGEFLAILGPSGCGKTSTLRMIAGLEDISDGNITIDKKIVNDLSPSERDIAMAFEDYALYPALSVFDNIAFPLKAPSRSHEYALETINEKVHEIAEITGLTPILNHRVNKLSGGQQQRISLARALIRPASVYLLDEPLSHLDSRQRLDIRANLKRMHLVEKKTMILVTHDQAEALSMADRIVLMNFGNIQQIGSPWEIFNRPVNLLVANFIGDPPMNFIEAAYDPDNKMFISGKYKFDVTNRIKEKIHQTNNSKKHRYQIGIRPNHLKVSKDKNPKFPIYGSVDIIEPLGDEIIITVACDQFKIKAILPNDYKTTIGETVYLQPHPDYLHVFEPDNGNRL